MHRRYSRHARNRGAPEKAEDPATALGQAKESFLHLDSGDLHQQLRERLTSGVPALNDAQKQVGHGFGAALRAVMGFAHLVGGGAGGATGSDIGGGQGLDLGLQLRRDLAPVAVGSP